MPSIDKDESKWEPVNPLIDGRSHVEAAIEYERKANILTSGSDTIILTGSGARVNVRNRALNLHQGRTHVPQEVSDIALWAGTHNVKRLVILSDDGYITFDAIDWCQDQGINIIMLDRDGNVVLTSGEYGCDVGLRRLQYEANDTGVSGFIAREVIKLKTLAQIDVLKAIPERPRHGETMDDRVRGITVFKDSAGRLLTKSAMRLLIDVGLPQIQKCKSVVDIMILEAQLADYYWDVFYDRPIKWKPKDEKIVPPHWKVITGRISSLSGTNARHAINPFQSVLNYAYGMLEAQVLIAINLSGLDPSVGCLHQDRIGRNSLVFDFMEPHRPQVDRLVLDLFEKTTFTRGIFVPLDSGEVRMSKQFARYVAASCSLPLDDISRTVENFIKVYRGG